MMVCNRFDPCRSQHQGGPTDPCVGSKAVCPQRCVRSGVSTSEKERQEPPGSAEQPSRRAKRLTKHFRPGGWLLTSVHVCKLKYLYKGRRIATSNKDRLTSGYVSAAGAAGEGLT